MWFNTVFQWRKPVDTLLNFKKKKKKVKVTVKN